MAKTKRSPSPVPSEEEDDTVYEVEKIVKHRLTEEPKGYAKYEFLVRWKGYAPEQDTWEPREGIEDGAEAALSAYIKQKGTRGIIIHPDGTKMSKVQKDSGKPRQSEIEEISDSQSKKPRKSEVRESPAEDRSARKKRESQAVVEEAPRRRKVETAASEEPPAKKAKAKRAIEIEDDDDMLEEEDIASIVTKRLPVEDEAPASAKKPKKSTTEQPKKPTPQADISVSVSPKKAKEAVIGSVLYKGTESWEHLLTVDTLEVDVDGSYRWAVLWTHLDGSDRLEWVPNVVGRRRFPQKLLDFYQLHLKFKTSEDETGEPANGKNIGDAMEED